MNQNEVLEAIENGVDTTLSLLSDADPNLIRRFRRIDTSIVKLLDDVRKHFPDAGYYTASGGFNLMLGDSHDDRHSPQSELMVLSGKAEIGDGDF